jgi:hypothetical protein
MSLIIKNKINQKLNEGCKMKKKKKRERERENSSSGLVFGLTTEQNFSHTQTLFV